jgi:hypothetical protein
VSGGAGERERGDDPVVDVRTESLSEQLEGERRDERVRQASRPRGAEDPAALAQRASRVWLEQREPGCDEGQCDIEEDRGDDSEEQERQVVVCVRGGGCDDRADDERQRYQAEIDREEQEAAEEPPGQRPDVRERHVLVVLPAYVPDPCSARESDLKAQQRQHREVREPE